MKAVRKIVAGLALGALLLPAGATAAEKNIADIVLPACSSVERSEVRCYPEKWVTATEPAVAPLGESRSDTDIVFALAHELGLDDPLLDPGREGASDPAAAFAAAVDWVFEPSGMTVAELAKHPGGMPVRDPLAFPERRYLRDGFPTPSGKMELASSILERLGPGIGADDQEIGLFAYR